MEIKFIVDVVLIVMCYHLVLNIVTRLLTKLKDKIEKSIEIVDTTEKDWY